MYLAFQFSPGNKCLLKSINQNKPNHTLGEFHISDWDWHSRKSS